MRQALSRAAEAVANEEQLIDLTPDVVAFVGADGVVQQVNRAWRDVFGDACEGAPVAPLIASKDPDGARLFLEELAEEGRVLRRLPVLDCGGRERWFDWVAIRSNSSRLHFYGRDVTETVTAFRKLAEQEETQAKALAALDAGVFEVDLKRGWVTLSSNFKQFMTAEVKKELSLEEFTRIAKLRTTPEGFDTITNAWNRFFAGADRVEYENPWLQADGSVIWNRVLLVARYGPGGQRDVVGVSQDISTRVRELDALRHAEAAARQANETKSAFLAKMTHELRTPLNAIIGFGEILEESAREREAAQDCADADRLLAAARHLLSLIDSILDLSKIEAGKIELACSTIDLRRLGAYVLETMGPLADKRGNRLLMEAPDELPAIVTDAFRLKQCLLNLLSNACKFTEGGEITLSMRLADPDWMEIAVSDTGAGIPADSIQRLFKPFSQVSEGRGIAPSGTGLGLSITRELATLLGGDVTVDSTYGCGTTFLIRLPVAGPPELGERPPG